MRIVITITQLAITLCKAWIAILAKRQSLYVLRCKGPARYNVHIGLYQVMILGIMVVPNTKVCSHIMPYYI